MGLYFELQNPGAIFPGVLGAIFLILAFFGLSVLPVNYAGVALVMLAVVFFIAEIKVPSFGLLTVGGVVSLVLGGMMLFDSPDPALEVSRSVLAGVAGFGLLAGGLVAALVVRSRRGRVHTGSEGMIGEVGRVFADLVSTEGAPRGGEVRGKVFIQGEIWNAVSDQPLARDTPVRVLAVEGLTLRVRPAATAAGAAPGAAGAVE
jgi:membrane-bound serine protease (ClpP class)